jgi:hypothetical protein
MTMAAGKCVSSHGNRDRIDGESSSRIDGESSGRRVAETPAVVAEETGQQ